MVPNNRENGGQPNRDQHLLVMFISSFAYAF
jgi:hypothetical protein